MPRWQPVSPEAAAADVTRRLPLVRPSGWSLVNHITLTGPGAPWHPGPLRTCQCAATMHGCHSATGTMHGHPYAAAGSAVASADSS